MIELLLAGCLVTGGCRDFSLLYDSREVSLLTCMMSGQAEVAKRAIQSGKSPAGAAVFPRSAATSPDSRSERCSPRGVALPRAVDDTRRNVRTRLLPCSLSFAARPPEDWLVQGEAGPGLSQAALYIQRASADPSLRSKPGPQA